MFSGIFCSWFYLNIADIVFNTRRVFQVQRLLYSAIQGLLPTGARV
jgi:hypothetical protein